MWRRFSRSLRVAVVCSVRARRRTVIVHSVVGPHRLPAMEDIPSLTYTQAVTLEVMRLYPVLPFSVPHASIEDDEYGGYDIPGGSTIIGVRISRHFRNMKSHYAISERMVGNLAQP